VSTLIVFDIDGTLLRSVAPHQAAFHGALRDCGLAEIDSAWGGYTHHTDSWIFREVFRRNHGRVPAEEETLRFAGRLHERFAAAVEREAVAELPGAAAFLHALSTSPEYRVAYATGGMREVTTVKLAGLTPPGVCDPVATASEHTFREHILREAIEQSRQGADGGGFDRVIAVGDGPWDVRAAVTAGIQFIGIGESTAPFGAWFPRTHLFASFDDVDLDRDYTLAPPPGEVVPAAGAGEGFTARPRRCACWN
jgi:phosphoglycolate phosphatase-like HAD superfamily hydrolase